MTVRQCSWTWPGFIDSWESPVFDMRVSNLAQKQSIREPRWPELVWSMLLLMRREPPADAGTSQRVQIPDASKAKEPGLKGHIHSGLNSSMTRYLDSLGMPEASSFRRMTREPFTMGLVQIVQMSGNKRTSVCVCVRHCEEFPSHYVAFHPIPFYTHIHIHTHTHTYAYIDYIPTYIRTDVRNTPHARRLRYKLPRAVQQNHHYNGSSIPSWKQMFLQDRKTCTPPQKMRPEREPFERG